MRGRLNSFPGLVQLEKYILSYLLSQRPISKEVPQNAVNHKLMHLDCLAKIGHRGCFAHRHGVGWEGRFQLVCLFLQTLITEKEVGKTQKVHT